MKAKVSIWMFVGRMLCFCSVLSASAATPLQEKIKVLQSFVSRQVLFDDSTSTDSIISWSVQVLPTLQKGNDPETYYRIQLLLANAYTMRGDISLATRRAQQMYEDAKDTEYSFGAVLANQAVGDAYSTIDNMCDKALGSYEDALTDLNNISFQHPYKIRLLLRKCKALQREGQFKEAQEVLERLERLSVHIFDYATAFFFHIEKANFAIHQGNLEEAKVQIAKMDAIFQEHREKYYRFYMNFTSAAYFRAMGKTDKQYWEQALYIYTKIQEEYSDNKRCIYYRWASLEKVQLCKMMGMTMEACRIYQELYPQIDTLASQSYIRQINAIKAKYLINKIETASNTEYNKIITGLLVGSLVMVALLGLITFLLMRQREKVKLSTQRLEKSRVNAENATHAKSVFLSNMSHEIRTPLNALSGFSSLLTEEGLDDETRRQCNEVIQQNSELLLKLINDIIDLSNFEFGKLQLTIEPHDAVSICRNVIDTVNKVKQTEADVLFDTELEEMDIETDASRLQQVLINLLINATKFTPQGNITLKLEKQTDEMLFFTVTDTGCGIPKEKQANIFQRFEKLNENVQGSGLGLSICQLIIEHVGGKIWIDPDYTDGCRFCFTHPVSQRSRKEGKK